MTRNDYIGYLICLIIIAVGIYLKGFIGGSIAGSFSTILLFVTIGKWQARKAIAKVEKIINDHQQN